MSIICGAIGFLIGLILFFFVGIIVDWPHSRETLRELWVGHREVPVRHLATVDELMQEIEWCLRHGGEFVWTDPGSYTIDSYNPQYFLIHERY